MIMPIKRYADFEGRSRRKEYWMFVLFQFLLLVPVGIILSLFSATEAGGESTLGGIFLIVVGLIYLGVFLIPGIAVQVRRFHDQDKSGWFILLGFIPYVGSIVLLVFMCLEGTKGSNRFGPDPKDETV
jgi:uncharacterized membrane protein YhaH (DUF805 family)